jgi:hypothetical protein
LPIGQTVAPPGSGKEVAAAIANFFRTDHASTLTAPGNKLLQPCQSRRRVNSGGYSSHGLKVPGMSLEHTHYLVERSGDFIVIRLEHRFQRSKKRVPKPTPFSSGRLKILNILHFIRSLS